MRQRSKLHWSKVVCRPWAIVVYNVEPTLGQRRNAIWVATEHLRDTNKHNTQYLISPLPFNRVPEAETKLMSKCIPPSRRKKLGNNFGSSHRTCRATRYSCWSSVNTAYSWPAVSLQHTREDGGFIGRLEIEWRQVDHRGIFLQGMTLFSRGASHIAVILGTILDIH